MENSEYKVMTASFQEEILKGFAEFKGERDDNADILILRSGLMMYHLNELCKKYAAQNLNKENLLNLIIFHLDSFSDQVVKQNGVDSEQLISAILNTSGFTAKFILGDLVSYGWIYPLENKNDAYHNCDQRITFDFPSEVKDDFLQIFAFAASQSCAEDASDISKVDIKGIDQVTVFFLLAIAYLVQSSLVNDNNRTHTQIN